MRTPILLILFAAAVPILAQEPAAGSRASVYKVDFTIRDGSDSATSGRRYSMLIEPGGKGTFRVGTKVAYATGTMQSGSAPVATQYNFADIGVSIDARLRAIGDKLDLGADID